MTEARFFDGLEARVHPARVAADAAGLTIEADGQTHYWPFAGLSFDSHGGETRLSHRTRGAARLILPDAQWRTLAGSARERIRDRGRHGHWALVACLVAAAAVVAGFVFFGMPVLSGPLARATPVGYERRMGENFEAQMALAFPACEGEAGQRALAHLGTQVAAYADTPFDVRVRAVHAPMVNAFALPGGAILITDDLIREAETSDELAAVVAHEVAHIEKRHVMQAVWRLLGIGMVLDAVVGGGSGAGQQAVLLAGQAADLRYSRKAEAEADARGMELLHAQGMSSLGMAAFFARLETGQAGEAGSAQDAAIAEFLSTHPDVARRVRAARAMERPGFAALDDEQWSDVQAACATPPSSRRGLPDLRRTAEPSG